MIRGPARCLRSPEGLHQGQAGQRRHGRRDAGRTAGRRGRTTESGFAGAASSFFVRRVNQFTPVEPSFLYVTKISQAVQAQVTVSQANSVYLGQKLEFLVPASFGMVSPTFKFDSI